MLEKEKVALTLKLTGDPKEWDLGQPERQSKELDPVQIQTCHFMVTHFLDQLVDQGEAALVQKFKLDPESQEQAIQEIGKTVNSILKVVANDQDLKMLMK